MNRTFCLKVFYGVILVLLGIICCWIIFNTSNNYRFFTLLFITLFLLIPGRINQYFYQDLYTGRKYLDKNDLEKALYYFQKFEHCIEEKPWKKNILWLSWSFYTTDVLAMVKHNISSVYINKGQYEEAEKYIKEALIIDNKYPLPYLNLSIINTINGEKEECVKNIEISRKLGMNNTNVDMFIKKMQSIYANTQSFE